MPVKNSSAQNLLAKVKTRKFLVPLVIIVLAVALYFLKGQLIAATVNGEPISRLALIKELEKQEGAKTLDSLITQTLILQEAKKQKIIISDDELGEEIKKLEESFTKQGQNLNQLLEVQGVSQNELRKQIRLQKIVEKLAGKDIQVSEQEINDYLEKNKNLLPKDAKPEDLKLQAKEQLEQEKLNSQIQSLIQSLRQSAKINYFLRF